MDTLILLYFFFDKILIFLGFSSVVVGTLLAIYSSKIKRLLAYSAIVHVGYIFLSIALLVTFSTNLFLIYAIVYAYPLFVYLLY